MDLHWRGGREGKKLSRIRVEKSTNCDLFWLSENILAARLSRLVWVTQPVLTVDIEIALVKYLGRWIGGNNRINGASQILQ